MIEESLNKAIKRIQKKKKMQEASGLAARMSAAYTKNKDIIKARKGIKKPKKGGALVTTKGSAIKKTGSSALTPVKDARAGITRPEPEAKDQTIDVKATEVGGDLAKKKSKVGSMSNSGKKTVDPKKNTSIVKVGKQNDNSKTYDKERLSQNRGRYRSTDKQDKEQEEKDKEEASKKRKALGKKVAKAAASTIGGVSSAYGTSSFNVKEGKTFAQFIDDAVVLDETLMPGDKPDLGTKVVGGILGGIKFAKNRIVTPVVNMIKRNSPGQKKLPGFEGPKKDPKSWGHNKKDPRREYFKNRRDKAKNINVEKKTKEINKNQSLEANKREWERLKKQNIVSGDFDPNYFNK